MTGRVSFWLQRYRLFGTVVPERPLYKLPMAQMFLMITKVLVWAVIGRYPDTSILQDAKNLIQDLTQNKTRSLENQVISGNTSILATLTMTGATLAVIKY